MTRMINSYQQAKQQCPDAVLLFRMGDFYEAFYEDAKTCAAKLGLTLTISRKVGDSIPMTGFPHHYLDKYVRDLVAKGCRVAVAEQVDNVPTGKRVTTIVTEGSTNEQ